MDILNNKKLFKFNKKLSKPVIIGFNKINITNISIPQLGNFELCRTYDNYFNELYSKVPHHSHR